MKITDIKNLINYKSRDLIPVECEYCQKVFNKEKHEIQKLLKHNRKNFCSRKCLHKSITTIKQCNCKQCNAICMKLPNEIKKAKNVFCSTRCAGIYNSHHKKHSTGQRSKLEKWLEIKLKELYPNLIFLFNDVLAIKAELDIYIPSLNLAFELNGAFHYEPIFGLEKLTSTQKNDKRKILASAENNIELCVIDSSGQKYFKELTSIKYLEIIKNIINLRLNMVSLGELESPVI